MATLAILALALFTGSTQAVFRISGGEPTTIEKYPSLVQVEFASVSTGIWSQSCAASILSSFYVLSAASCFHGINYDAKNRRIRAGTTYRETGGIVSYVQVEFNHPTYGPNGNDGDITVVRLLDQLAFSAEVQQGVIIAGGTAIPDNVAVIHAGWGATSQGGSYSPELLDTTIYTINRELCAELYSELSIPEIVTENMICAGILDVEGHAACQGDDGGPLYYRDAVVGDIIIGVISWGYGCSMASLPGVSTAVSSYTEWIQAVAA